MRENESFPRKVQFREYWMDGKPTVSAGMQDDNVTHIVIRTNNEGRLAELFV